MSLIDVALRIAERVPAIGALPCPPWVAREIAAHPRRRMLVLEIYAMSDRTTAFAALWLARAYALAPGYGGTVEGGLRFFREMVARGGW